KILSNQEHSPGMSQGKSSRESTPKRILHVAYYESLLKTRAILLKNQGYVVTSVLGNLSAIATDISNVDLVLIGFSSTYEQRAILFEWLKQRRPDLPIVVLQSQSGEQFPAAKHVAPADPEIWLKEVALALERGKPAN